MKTSLREIVFETKISIVLFYLIAFLDFSGIIDENRLGSIEQVIVFSVFLLKFFGIIVASRRFHRGKNDSDTFDYFNKFYTDPPISQVLLFFIFLIGIVYMSIIEDHILSQFFYNVFVIISCPFFLYFQFREDRFNMLLENFRRLSDNSKS